MVVPLFGQPGVATRRKPKRTNREIVAPVLVRRARTADVDRLHDLVRAHAGAGLLLEKNRVTLYEDVQEFLVAEEDRRVVGCGALHVLWRDLAEVRTLVVDDAYRGRGIGGALLRALLGTARELGVERVFCLTFETAFFAAYGFAPIDGVPVDHDTYAELLRSYDDGVAEFLDLERVKPNTLGNTRMLVNLHP
jgi:amino-acid N-acetyltransferase